MESVKQRLCLTVTAARALQFNLSMLGNMSEDAIAKFWEHCRACPDWAEHPIFENGANMQRVVPLVFHIDGAELYRNTEHHIISMSSMLSSLTVTDVFDKKFMNLVLPHEVINVTKKVWVFIDFGVTANLHIA